MGNRWAEAGVRNGQQGSHKPCHLVQLHSVSRAADKPVYLFKWILLYPLSSSCPSCPTPHPSSKITPPSYYPASLLPLPPVLSSPITPSLFPCSWMNCALYLFGVWSLPPWSLHVGCSPLLLCPHPLTCPLKILSNFLSLGLTYPRVFLISSPNVH